MSSTLKIFLLFTSVFLIGCRPHYILNGIVQSSAKKPVSGAKIVLTQEGQADSLFTESGSDGTFIIEKIKPGPVSIKISFPEYKDLTKDLVLNSKYSFEQFFLSQRPTVVSGRILRTEDNKELNNVGVYLLKKPITYSDQRGRYEFELPPENQNPTLVFSKQYYDPHTIVTTITKHHLNRLPDIWLSTIPGMSNNAVDSLSEFGLEDQEISKDARHIPDSNFFETLCQRDLFDYQDFTNLFKQLNTESSDSVVKRNFEEFIENKKIVPDTREGLYHCSE